MNAIKPREKENITTRYTMHMIYTVYVGPYLGGRVGSIPVPVYNGRSQAYEVGSYMVVKTYFFAN